MKYRDKIFNFRLTGATKKRIDELAKKENCSKTELMERTIKAYYERTVDLKKKNTLSIQLQDSVITFLKENYSDYRPEEAIPKIIEEFISRFSQDEKVLKEIKFSKLIEDAILETEDKHYPKSPICDDLEEIKMSIIESMERCLVASELNKNEILKEFRSLLKESKK